VVVDADTGAVIERGNERTPLRVASVLKVLTAVVVVEHLAPDDEVPVSARAEGMPARRIQLKQGEVWRVDHLLHALLLVSANDAAVALAERAGGSMEGFEDLYVSTAVRLGMADNPVLRDPAGLDDEFSVAGGNLVSARDLAIATRAFLAYPELASIVTMPESSFTGGDAEPHRLLNHNRLLRLYPGAIGVKTGYTKRAGHSLIAAARRDGRTMVAVVIGAPDPYGSAVALLDKGFSVPVDAQRGLDRLPRVALEPRQEVSAAAPLDRPSTADADDDRGRLPAGDLVLLLVGGTPAVAILVRRRQLDRERLARSRTRERVAA
jgi:D-alanyl-D-alanine carboxypeptidase